MITMIAFTGYSQSGKTMLMSGVIHMLTERGYKVASIKHDGHSHNLFSQNANADSSIHKKAGAKCSIVSNAKGYVMETDSNADTSPEELAALVPADIDIVLCEGFKSSGLPKIEVIRQANSTIRSNQEDPNLIAVATDMPDLKENVKKLDLNNIAEVTDFVEEYLKINRQKISLHLIVNGTPVPTKSFIQDMLTYSIHGLIKALKGSGDPKEIIIKASYK